MRTWVIAALLVAGCKREETPSRPPDAAKPSTAVLDALWKLAPDGAEAGVVISDRGLTALEGGWQQLRKLIAVTPELAEVNDKIERELQKALGTSTVSLATAGMSAAKGMAVFLYPDDRDVVVMPVVDRDKFLKLTNGTKGKDGDRVDDMTCKTVLGRYACSKTPELIDRLGKAPMGDKIKVVGTRGDIEMAGTMVEDGQPVTIGVVAQLERGGFTLRAAFKGMPAEAVNFFKAGGPPPVDASRAVGYAIFNLVAPLQMMPVPPTPIVAGVTLADLARNVDGPVTISIAPGTTVFDVRIPQKDTAAARKLVEHCDQIPALAAIGATVTNGICHVSVPQMMLELDGWIEGKQLRFGKKGAAAPAPMVPTAIASELARGDWAFAMFGRGSLLGEGKFPPLPIDQMPTQAKLGIKALSLFNEIGFGIRLDGDTARILFSVRTALSNPDDVIQKLLAITPDQIVTGKASALAKQIATASPASPFAQDFKAGVGGIMIPTGFLGIIAAVAVPAYMDYMKKSKKTEASLQLERLDKTLKLAHATKGAFPKGKVGPTPATSCCQGPNHKCDEPAAWNNPLWKQLDFDMPDAHLFRYAYESNGKTFDAKAIADLDCDGIEITYVLHGAADANGNVTTTIIPPPPNSD